MNLESLQNQDLSQDLSPEVFFPFCSTLWNYWFPGGTSCKEPISQCGRHKRHGFDPWFRKISGERHGNPLQWVEEENPMDRGDWWDTVQIVAKSKTWLKWLSMHKGTEAISCWHINIQWILQFNSNKSKLGLFSSVQSLSRVRLFATPWIAAHQASLSITNSRSSLRFTSIESVMPSSHLILCRPLLLLPSIFPSIRVFSNESALCIRWPKYWSFSFNISPSNEHPGLISPRMDWLDHFILPLWNLGRT